jgi:hypothetical protein
MDAKVLSIKPLHIKGPNLDPYGISDLKEEEERVKETNLGVFIGKVDVTTTTTTDDDDDDDNKLQ